MFFTLIFGAVLIVSIFRSVKAKEKCRQAYEEERIGSRILKAHHNQISFLPKEYLNPVATEYLLKIVGDKRASNLNQALEICDRHLRHLETQRTLNHLRNDMERMKAQLEGQMREMENAFCYWYVMQ